MSVMDISKLAQFTDIQIKQDPATSSSIDSAILHQEAIHSNSNPRSRTLSVTSSTKSEPSCQSRYPTHSSKPSLVARERSSDADDGANTKTLASTSVTISNDIFAGSTLPLPPTRPWKIIQLEPRELQLQQERAHNQRQRQHERKAAADEARLITTTTGKAAAVNPVASAGPRSSKGGQVLGPRPTTERKIARKTAHSRIERRRRSKINEEFRILKDMIPACVGQDMYKLDILQASIEYMRYLEKCLIELKAAHSLHRHMPSQSLCLGTPTTTSAPLATTNTISHASISSSSTISNPNDNEMPDASACVTLRFTSTPPTVPASGNCSIDTSPLYRPIHSRSTVSSSNSKLHTQAISPGHTCFSSSNSTLELVPEAEHDDHGCATAQLTLNPNQHKWSGTPGYPSGTVGSATPSSVGGRSIRVQDLLSR